MVVVDILRLNFKLFRVANSEGPRIALGIPTQVMSFVVI